MAHRQLRCICSPRLIKKRIATDEKGTCALSNEICEGFIDLTFGAGLKENELQAEGARCLSRLIFL